MRLCLLAVCAVLGARLGAVEKATPELQRQRRTSTIREISIKPLFAYSERGRRDPFEFDFTLYRSPVSVARDFSIAELQLVGVLGHEESRTALLWHKFRRVTYRFRQGQLFSNTGVPMANIKGTFLSDKELSLTQGESNMIFQLASNSKLRSLEATIAQDRKEQQK